jgi:hypothetical protein
VSPGSRVPLTASASDPDGDEVTFRWAQYREAGTYGGAVELSDPGSATVTVAVPDDARPGETVHLILRARDDGDPPLTAYARVILTVSAA